MKVSEMLQVKGDILYTGTPAMSMKDAVSVMEEKDIGSLVVIESGEVVGMLTFREVIRAVASNGGTLGTGTVREFMVKHPKTLTPETELNEVRRLILEGRARYLPVMSDKTLLGVISFYDVARALVQAQSFENKMLKAYINDSRAEQDE